jgi:hypothetical protein
MFQMLKFHHYQCPSAINTQKGHPNMTDISIHYGLPRRLPGSVLS